MIVKLNLDLVKIIKIVIYKYDNYIFKNIFKRVIFYFLFPRVYENLILFYLFSIYLHLYL